MRKCKNPPRSDNEPRQGRTHDCMDGDVIPLTQEFLGQMLGVRLTTVTLPPYV